MPEDYGKPEFNPDFFKVQPLELILGGHFFVHTTLKDTIDLIDRVIYHDPATIIYWKDHTKTVVKCADGFEYDEVIGFLMCILRKTLNGRQYTKLCDAMAKPYAIRKMRHDEASMAKKREEMSNQVRSRIDILEDEVDALNHTIYRRSCNPSWWDENKHTCDESCSCKK